MDLSPRGLIDLVFPGTDIRDHLIEKYTQCRSVNFDFFSTLIAFYEKLDNDHQAKMELFFLAQCGAIAKTTVPYMLEIGETIPGHTNT